MVKFITMVILNQNIWLDVGLCYVDILVLDIGELVDLVLVFVF
jgi:hypothetical protein